ncbi:MAG: SurA N-terminal domain-containing protein [Fimbriimonas sp.]
MKTQNILFGWASACALLIIVGCGSKGEETVATVNGEPITKKAYLDHLERKQVVQVQTPRTPVDTPVMDAPVVGSLGLQAMQDLINRKLLLQMAEKEGVMPQKADIEKELAFQTKRRPDFVSYLTDRGLTIDMIKDDLKFDLARERLLTKGVNVTAADVDLYIKENPKEFMEPAQAQLLYVVVTSPEKKAQVDKELSTGQNFQVVATRYSEAPQARETGGMFQVSNVNAMPKKLQDLVRATPELKTTDWQHEGKSWVKFFVQKKQAERPIPMDETKKEFVRRQLAMQQGQRANDLGRRLNQMLTEGKINVTVPYLKGPWEKAIERAKAASNQPANAPSAG